MTYHFYLKERRLKKSKTLQLIYKTEYVIHIRNLKQAFNHGLVLKKVQRTIETNQNAWLKSYIDMNTDLRKKQKVILKKAFLSSRSFWPFKCSFWKMLWKKWEHIEILNLSQQRKEETI